MSSASLRFAIQIASYVLVGIMCLLALTHGLLPGLLGVCLGYVLTVFLCRLPGFRGRRFTAPLTATLVIGTPMLGLLTIVLHAKGVTLTVLDQYQDLLHYLARTILDIRSKLPEDLARHLPEGSGAVQQWMAAHLRSHASNLAVASRVWLHGILIAYVGLVIGSLVATSPAPPSPAPLASALRERALFFIDAFRQIVAAQFWIAAFNATLTAIFLLVALPLFSVHMPYDYALIALTFVAGLIPIVGNLLCNVVLTVVGLSVSPVVGVTCLLFLIAIHKFEYFINARVVGSRTKTTAWELLAAMFSMEVIFGIPGLVAAPLYYAYLKKELKARELV